MGSGLIRLQKRQIESKLKSGRKNAFLRNLARVYDTAICNMEALD
jgi:hypothetical protein